MRGDSVHHDPGAQHAAPARDHVIQPRVPDHHPVDPVRNITALEVCFRAAERRRARRCPRELAFRDTRR